MARGARANKKNDSLSEAHDVFPIITTLLLSALSRCQIEGGSGNLAHLCQRGSESGACKKSASKFRWKGSNRCESTTVEVAELAATPRGVERIETCQRSGIRVGIPQRRGCKDIHMRLTKCWPTKKSHYTQNDQFPTSHKESVSVAGAGHPQVKMTPLRPPHTGSQLQVSDRPIVRVSYSGFRVGRGRLQHARAREVSIPKLSFGAI